MIYTSSKMETLYLLARGFRTRGCEVTAEAYNVKIWHSNGHFCVGLMPGNRRILISFNSYIAPEMRDKGLGQRLLRLRQDVAREAGINLMLCTVRDDNKVERHLLRKAGWHVLAPRPETGVSLWAKRLCR